MRVDLTSLHDLLPRLHQKHLLLSNIGDVAFINRAAQIAEQVAVFHVDWVILQTLETLFADYPNVIIHQMPFPTDTAVYDTAMIELPIGRGFARAILATALQALRGPSPFLAATGKKRLGAHAALRDLQALCPTEISHQTEDELTFVAHITDSLNIPGTWGTPWLPAPQEYIVGNTPYTLYSQPGIYSWNRIDDGAQFFLSCLEDLPLPQGGRLLDAGCGYGLLGRVLAEKLECQPIWVDKNLLATQCVRQSAPDDIVLTADLLSNPLTEYAPFDTVIVNPPFYDAYEGSRDFMQAFAAKIPRLLAQDGVFVMIANRNYRFHRFLEAYFDDVQVVQDNNAYHIVLTRH